LTAANAVDYLRGRGFLTGNEPAEARELVGGVSNEVILVSRPQGENVVLKQVRERLNVADPWHCSVERIWRETDVLRECDRLLEGERSQRAYTVGVPRFFFDDRANYLYAMSAAPPDHVVWKNELLSGLARTEIAAACGSVLGTLHGKSWHDALVASRFNDRQFFEDLRIDPYYRQVSRVLPEFSAEISRLIDSVWHERHALVHGDFSPKNLLVHGNRVTLIDFEVGHYGDAAFDLGFFLTHLVFKAFYHATGHAPFLNLINIFWDHYSAAIMPFLPASEFESLVSRSVQNFAGCALARLFGKSKIDYLNDNIRRNAIFELCRFVFTHRPDRWAPVHQAARRLMSEEQLNS
jgi:5-methylthioribose kinase